MVSFSSLKIDAIPSLLAGIRSLQAPIIIVEAMWDGVRASGVE